MASSCHSLSLELAAGLSGLAGACTIFCCAHIEIPTITAKNKSDLAKSTKGNDYLKAVLHKLPTRNKDSGKDSKSFLG